MGLLQSSVVHLKSPLILCHAQKLQQRQRKKKQSLPSGTHGGLGAHEERDELQYHKQFFGHAWALTVLINSPKNVGEPLLIPLLTNPALALQNHKALTEQTQHYES